MKTLAMSAAAVLALILPGWAQENGKDKPAVSETCEIRAYLLNKEKQTVNIVGITAMLVVEGKEGVDVRIPLQLVTTKTEGKTPLHSSIAPREVEGTEYFASLVTIHPDGHRRSEANDADRRLAKAPTQDPLGKLESAQAESDRKRFALEGPYFKADLTREQLGAFTCQASVRFTIQGENRTAKGFRCGLSKSSESTCKPSAEECNQIERHLKANEMDKAGAAVDRLSASLCEPCGDAPCQRARHGCASCCKEIRAAISSGNREKALVALEALKSQCSPCSPSKTGPKTNGDSK
jgi:hypothetical protein